MGALVLTLDVVVVMTVSYGAPGFIVMRRLFFLSAANWILSVY